MYMVERYFFKYGNEDDEICSTSSMNKATFDKAMAHAERYAKGTRFSHYEIYDSETMELLYRKNYEGIIEDFR